MEPLDVTIQRAVASALVQTNRNVSAAARGLGVPRRTLTRWLHNWRSGHASVPAAQVMVGPRLAHASLRVTMAEVNPYTGVDERR